MAISRDEVLHVARLARLALTDEEVERLTEELGAILDAVGVVAELDLADVPPTSHPLDLVNVWDEDEPRPSLSARRGLRERARARRRPLPGSADRLMGAVIDTLRLTAEEREARSSSAASSRRPSCTPRTSTRSPQRDGELHCYLRTCEEPSGEGIPIALKDVISTKGSRRRRARGS